MKKIFNTVLIITICFALLVPVGRATAQEKVTLLNTLPYKITAIYTYNNLVFVGTTNGFFVSEDAGKHFSERDAGLGDFYITGVVYLGGKLFLGTENSGLYISDDLGKTWVSQMNKLDCPTISSVSVQNGIIYITSLCTGFHFSEDLGETWISRNGGLPTLRTTAFVKTPQGRCFLGTDQFGLFYSDTLGEKCVWDKFFSPYTITSISYINSTVVVGTNVGIFTGDILNDNFKKLNFIGGSPYIQNVIKVNDCIVVSVQGFGLFVSNDGKTFYRIQENKFNDATSVYFNSGKLYVGTGEGEIYAVDLSQPYLVNPHQIEVGSITKGQKINGSFKIFNMGIKTLSGSIDSPYFISFNSNSFRGNAINLDFTIDTSALTEGEYTEAVHINSNGGNRTIYINFVVEKPSSVIIKLKIGSHEAFVGGKSVYLDAPPFIVKSAGRTLVPLRFISEAFGAKVQWDPDERKVTIRKDPTENHPPILIELWIGKKTISVNLKKEVIDVAPVIIPPGRTMVPLRFISETFGSDVKWNAITREITIVYTP